MNRSANRGVHRGVNGSGLSSRRARCTASTRSAAHPPLYLHVTPYFPPHTNPIPSHPIPLSDLAPSPLLLKELLQRARRQQPPSFRAGVEEMKEFMSR